MPSKPTSGASRYNPRPRRPRPDDDDAFDVTPAPPRDVDIDPRDDPIEREMRARADERAASHWHTWRCPAGHVFETHRTTSDAAAPTERCVICGRDATYETPTDSVRREWDADHTPIALMRAWADTLGEWAQQQLNAKSWTVKSRQQRLAAHRQQQARRTAADRASADIFPPDF